MDLRDEKRNRKQWNKIGILCASDTELEPFLQQAQITQETEACMLRVYEGNLEGRQVALLYSGVCKVNAAIAAQLLIHRFQTDAVINAGVAGGIAREAALFDTIVARQCAYHDVAEDILTEFHPWMPSVYFDADPRLLLAAREFAAQSGLSVKFGTIVTGEQFVEKEEKMRIREVFAPLAADMESASAAQVCYVNKIPFLSVRTITDNAESESGQDAFEENCEKASWIASRVVCGILRLL